MQRIPLALVLALVLALAVPLAAAPTSAINTTSYCKLLQERSNLTGYRKLHTNVTLVWGAAPAGAAAALLRAALLAAGARRDAVVLRKDVAAAQLCDLFAAHPAPSPDHPTGEVVIALATEWRPRARACSWDKGVGALRVQGEGAAPASARLHARLAPRHVHADACREANEWNFYEDAAALRECGFSVPSAPGTNNTKTAIVYVLDDEWESAANELRESLGGHLMFERVARGALKRLVTRSNDSFLFLDADMWRGEHGGAAVRLVEEPRAAADAAPVSLRVADEYSLRLYAPTLHVMFSDGVFTPRAAALRAVLARAAALGVDVSEAACDLARSGSTELLEFDEWRQAAARNVQYLAIAFVCKDEADDEEYDVAVTNTGEYIYNSTYYTHELSIEIPIRMLDCRDDGELSRELLELKCSGRFSRTAFVVASADLVRKAAPYASDFGLPLLAYDVAPYTNDTLPGAAGDAKHLAAALRRLLADCGWRRLAVVTEPTALASALNVALSDPAGLTVQEQTITTNPETIGKALGKLVEEDARVFLVNAGAGAAAAVLAAACDSNLTPERGYVWIVRDYGTADAATKALKPYSVSTQCRGECRAPRELPTAELLQRLEKRWAKRAWPRHASRLVDALLTLAEGFKRLMTNIVRKSPEIMDPEHRKKKLRYFWDLLQSENISGIVEDMSYHNYGIAAPLVYVERWGADQRPLRLAVWRAGEHRAPAEACPRAADDGPPPHDGTSRCRTPYGGAFHPSCMDSTWAVSGTALLLAAVALPLAAWRLRQALRRRDARIRAAVAERMLARRSRAFAALTPHLVKRAALELREELGAGRFGRVRLGLLRESSRARPTLVAAKALREDAGPAEETQFLKEACTLAALEHEHVVRFAGVCVEDGPPLLLMEHAFFGDLRRYLEARRHLAEGAPPGGAAAAGPEEAAYVSAEALTRLAHEAASALSYLALRRLVHRDVRASNCLVDARRSLKLADFGLARETGATDGEYACRGRAMFPVLWMAPESLAHGVCSAASDVWAFGVLALELVMLGARPYGDASPPSVVRLVLAGGRPPLPRDASAGMRAVARACWRRDPAARPTARRLAAWLAAQRRALRPALAVELDDMDADSGFGDAPAAYLDAGAPLLDAPDAVAAYLDAPDGPADYVDAPDDPLAYQQTR